MEKKKKPFYKKWWVWVIAIIIVGVANSGGGEDTETAGSEPEKTAETTSEVQATDTKEEKPKEDAKQQFTVGQDVTVGKFVYKVNSIEEVTTLSSILGDKTTTGKFAVIDLSVTNIDKKARMADTNMFKIKTADGTEYEADLELDMYVNEGDTGFFLQDINPNLSKTGKVVFELPTTATEYNLEVSSGFGWSGGDYEQIKVK